MNLGLKCSCGAVRGVATNITPATGNRVVCCCEDCQKFAHYLNGGDEILDEFGGTDIFQISQSQVKIEAGAEHLRCLRLTSKGLLRWYTACCNTPIGNSVSAGVPFIGVIHSFMDVDGDSDDVLGGVRAYVQTQYARGKPNYPHSAKKFPLGITLQIMRKMLIWKIKGMNKPSAFFSESGKPIIKPTIVN